jgi:hypothetical protein
MKTNSVLLRQAKQIILTDGWTQGISGMLPEGPACLLGAIGRAAGIEPQVRNGHIDMTHVIRLPVHGALVRCIAAVDPQSARAYSPTDRAWRYNDRTYRTQEDIVKVLNDCANLEEAAGR